MENTRNKPARQRLPLAVYLAFLLVAALAFTGASFASYKTEASVSDSAMVARFAYSAQPGQDSTAIVLDATDAAKRAGQYSFRISNKDTLGTSEVAEKCDVIVTCAGKASAWLPSGVTMTLTCNGTNYNAAWNGTGYLFSGICTFAPGMEASADCVLKFNAEATAAAVSLTDISIIAHFEQID